MIHDREWMNIILWCRQMLKNCLAAKKSTELTYFQVNVAVLQFTLRNQRCLHRTKLCALWDSSL